MSFLLTRRLPRFLLCALVASAPGFSSAQAKSPLNLSVIQRDGYGVVPLRQPVPNELIVEARVNGKSLRLILDTGDQSDGMTLDSGYARGLHLSGKLLKNPLTGLSGKKITGVRQGSAETVELGNVQIQKMPVYLATMDSLRSREMHEAGAGANGFLGVQFLEKASAILDLQNLRLYLRPPEIGRAVALGPALKGAGLSEAPFVEASNGACLLDVSMNGASAKMIIDTGAYLTSVDGRFAARAKVATYRSNIRMMDVAGVEQETDWSTPKNFAVDGVPVHPPKIVFSDMSFYPLTHGQVVGLLGLDFLGQNWSILDFGQRKLYFSAIR